MKEMTVEMRCKAFSGDGIRLNKIMVESDGTLRVYDSVAGYYTTVHSLSKNARRKALAMVAKVE